jgi:2-polyprenyl-3-methyl-5-hydroxy-6-metoxy-1,4-benzoquinol methylase
VANEQDTANSADEGDDVTGTVRVHPERFDPGHSANTLMESEHRGRYSWAAQVVAGQSVLDAGCGTGYGLEILNQAGAAELTGVDIDPVAVEEASRRAAPLEAAVAHHDLHALEFADDSFDLAVCFETIEHLRSPRQGIAELRRVVRPGGVLIVSSPNPDVYPSGNDHHLHELRPDELRSLIEEQFETTQVFLQHPWLASLIEPAENGTANSGNGQAPIGIDRSPHSAAYGPTYAIAVGCDRDQPPRPSSLVTLGNAFEVRWWEDRVLEAERRPADEVAAPQPPASPDAEAVAELEKRLAAQALETTRSQQEAAAREAKLSERLRQTSAALIDANQELAQMPLLKERLAEIYAENAALQAQHNLMVSSRSWQITAVLRKLSASLKLQRH